MRDLKNIEDIVHLYDAFILDLWGVVHDGHTPFPDVIPTLQELRRAKRKVWLLSNVPRRAESVITHLDSMGVTADLYDGIMTSGEATHAALKNEFLPAWGRRCFCMDDQSDPSIMADLDVTMAKGPEEADFIYMSDSPDMTQPPESFRPVLEAAQKRGLPFVCPNPDRVVHVGDTLYYCPGSYAELYESLGGTVHWFGKPYRAVYSHLLAQMGGADLKILAIGDGMPTDIAGAAGMGLDSALVTTGIHRDDPMTPDFFAKYPFKPMFLMDKLNW
ncbi:MAG: TIGR01459 family HAD-type hydrolase [Alphaproteobacteria bacterium]|nr:TIGR01459 family HAD-type hydrolase [Alphaproteobacteria bacterium]